MRSTRTIATKIISTIEEIPSIEDIKIISRNIILKLIFEGSTQPEPSVIAKKLQLELSGFRISEQTQQPEISIIKLITDQEIEANQLFFEQCARDYSTLAKKLIFDLARHLKISINPEFPLISFYPKKQYGTMGEWKYFRHGYHCCFDNFKTGQVIEVPLVFGLEFGDLDPAFFTSFINSTKTYYPLPLPVFEDFTDGLRINEKMIALGKFEKITSNIKNHYGVALTERQAVPINIFEPDKVHIDKPKFKLWNF